MKEEIRLQDGLDGLVFHFAPVFQDFMLRFHRHSELELNLVISGEACYELEHSQYQMRPGTMVWILPDQEHRLSWWSDDFSMDIIVLKKELLEKLAEENHEYRVLFTSSSPETAYCRAIAHKYVEFIHGACQSIHSSHSDNRGIETTPPRYAGTVFGREKNEVYEHSDRELLNSGLRYLLSLCWKAYAETEDKPHTRKIHPGVKQAMDAISENLPESESMQELARSCGLSESRLSHVFKEFTGMTIPAYRNRIKLNRFLEIFTQGDLTMTEACYAADFGSYAQFHKVFKQCYKVGPREYLG